MAAYGDKSPYTGGKTKTKPYVSGSTKTKAALGRFGKKVKKEVFSPIDVKGVVGKPAGAFHTGVAKPVERSVTIPLNREIARASSTSGGQVGRKQRERKARSEAVTARAASLERGTASMATARSTGAGRVAPLFTGKVPTKGPKAGFVGGIGAGDAPMPRTGPSRTSTRTGVSAPATPTTPKAPKPAAAAPGSITTKDDITKLSYWLKRTEGMKNAKNKAYALMKRAQKADKAGTLRTKSGEYDVTKVLGKSWGQQAYKKGGF
jgi:hypothetical protein